MQQIEETRRNANLEINDLKNAELKSDTSISSALAMIAGEIVPLCQAKVPLLDRGLLFGQAIFETVRLDYGKPQDLQLHIARLEASRLKLNLPPIDLVELSKQSETLCNVFWSKERPGKALRGVLKIVLTSGSSHLLFDTTAPANLYLLCHDALETDDQDPQLQLLSVASIRDNRSVFFRNFKVTSYLPAFLSHQAARSRGFDDYIYYNESDEFTESGYANFIWIDKYDHIYTCHQENNALPGVTLERIESLLVKHGKAIERRALSRHSIAENCKGAVFVSSIKMARPIGSIDGVALNRESSIRLSQKLNFLLCSGV